MSLIVIKISLGTTQSKFVSTDCDEDKSKSVSYKQKKSYELKFYLQTENGPFRRACRNEFHIDTLQFNLVGINVKHIYIRSYHCTKLASEMVENIEKYSTISVL